MSKQGSTLAGVMDAFSVAIAIDLRYGVPLEAFVEKFTNVRFDPAGMTDDPDVRIAQSVMDYLFRRLSLDYLPFEKRSEVGIFSDEERAAAVSGGSYGAAVGRRWGCAVGSCRGALVDRAARGAAGTAADAPLCMTCGVEMRPGGSCYVCESCGSTSGCN
jgi:ribonucleoside-diphosphate reductase alpha chain